MLQIHIGRDLEEGLHEHNIILFLSTVEGVRYDLLHFDRRYFPAHDVKSYIQKFLILQNRYHVNPGL